MADKYGYYSPNATWPLAYGSDVQADIAVHQWSKAQADSYVAFQAANPTMLTAGLMAWFKADSGVSSGGDGTPVTSWADQTGNFTVTQASSDNQPAYVSSDSNGKSAVRFAGNQWLYNGSNLNLNSDMTIIAVVAPSTANTDYESLAYLGNQDGYSSRGLVYNGGVETFDSSSFNRCSGAPQPGVNQFMVEACELSSDLTDVTFYQNGQQSGAGTVTAVQTMTPGLTIGSINNSAGGPFQGDISEVLVYDHQLSSTELQEVGVYLADKYGLYNPNATWPLAYGSDVQELISENEWSKAEADAYVTSLVYSFTKISADPPIVAANTFETTPLTVKVATSAGDPVINTSVTFSIASGSYGTLAKTSGGTTAATQTVVTDTSGLANIYYQSGSDSGLPNDTITATTTSDSGVLTVNFTYAVSGLAAWLSADTNVTVDGSNHVTQWTDRGSNHYVLTPASSSNKPVLTTTSDGHAAIQFANTQELLTTSAISTLNAVTVITVATPANGMQVNLQGGSAFGFGYIGNNQSLMSYYRGSNARTSDGDGPEWLTSSGGAIPSSYGTWIMSDYAFTPSTVTGTYYVQGNANGTIEPPYGSAGLMPTSFFGLGIGFTGLSAEDESGAAVNESWNGSMAEVLVYDHVLSDIERGTVESYLANKYAVYTWTLAYSTDVQTLIAANSWNKAQADNYVAFLDAHPPTPPIPYSGLNLWLEADGGIVTSSGSVTTWQDQSWNHNDLSQATSAAMPSILSGDLAGHDVVHFDGLAQSLSGTVAVTGTATTFVVYRKPTSGGGSSSGGVVAASGSSGGFQVIPPTPSSGNAGSNRTFENVQTLSSVNLSSFNLGTNNYLGDIAAVIVYNRTLTTTEQNQVNQYLADKYEFYSPSATWTSSYSSDVQLQIVANGWDKEQADSYVALLGSSPSIPTNGLGVWLRADQGVTADVSGTVTTWSDQSGFKNDASGSAGAEPQLVSNALNGQPVVRFSGIQYLSILEDPSLDPANGYTIISVAKTTSGSAQILVSKPWSSANYNSPYASYALGINGSGHVQSTLTTVSQQSDLLSSSTALDTTQPFMATAVYDGVLQQVEGQGETPVVTPIVGAIDYGDFSEKRVTIGAASSATPQSYFNGDIAEVLIYNRALGPFELQEVAQYFTTKYGTSFTSVGPVISPAPASYTGTVTVTITGAPSGDTIHYTIDGTPLTSSSPTYTSGITLTGSALVRAAFYSGSVLVGEAASSQYYVNDPGHTGLASTASDVQSTLVSPNEMDVTWTLSGTPTYSAINIYRQVNGGAYYLLTTLGPGATSFTDLSVQAGNSYSYKVGTVNASGSSRSSASTSVSDSTSTQTITLTVPADATPLP